MSRYLIAGLLALALCCAALLWRVDHLAQQLTAAKDAAGQYQRSTESLRATIRTTRALLLELAALDQRHSEALAHANDENQRLRAAVAADAVRLRVRAQCAAVPTTASPTGLADAGTAELAADARPDYFTLRDQLALTRQMVLGLQDYVRHVCHNRGIPHDENP